MPKKLTLENFIVRSKLTHQNKYDYSLVKYVNNSTKIKIICDIHGGFEQTPQKHLIGRGCKLCGFIKRGLSNISNTDKFIDKSKKIHGDRYYYTLVDYKNVREKVKIICKEHGIFEQIPNDHLQGKGCQMCAGNIKLTTDEFIERSNKIHNSKYDYSLVDYKNNNIKVKIICSKHGIFEQQPSHHLNGEGCQKCAYEQVSLKLSSNTEEFIEKSKKIHGNKYDYSLVDYKGNNIKIDIICKKHGIFEQMPLSHLRGNGCSNCKNSKGENEIYNYLKNKKIVFETQKFFDGCRNVNPLFFDFYLPKYNICIEYDGIQHFKPVEKFGGIKYLKENKIRDKIKNNYCKNNNINLIRIKYDENIIEKLNNIIYIYLSLFKP